MRKIGFGIFLMGLVAAMLMGTGSAQETGTTQIAAQFPSYITVIAPAGINDWTLSVGDNTYPGTETATVRSNYPGCMCLAPTKMMRIDENPPRPEEIYNSSLISSYWEYARRRYYQAT